MTFVQEERFYDIDHMPFSSAPDFKGSIVIIIGFYYKSMDFITNLLLLNGKDSISWS
jgi:hypothetical protein